jgi:seryl-tRNA synthetase
MVELRILRNETERVIHGYTKRNLPSDQIALVHEIIEKDDLRKSQQSEIDQLLARVNQLSRDIGELYKSGKAKDAEFLKEEVAQIKEQLKTLETVFEATKAAIESALIQLPNVPHDSVPFGKSAEDNTLFKDWTKSLPVLPETALAHWDLAKKYDLFDMELGVKISGSGFILYRNKGARLQRALINFFLDEAVKAGYEEIQPPLLVNEDTAKATGQFCRKGQFISYTNSRSACN